MAVLASRATGNFLTNATWGLVDAVSLLDSEVGNTVVATAPAWGSSSAFTPGAITIDGIAIKLYARTGILGTISARLYDVTGGAPVAGTTVTINVADLPSCSAGLANNEGGWIMFAFAGVLLLGGGNQYRVEVQTSNATQVTLWRNGTAVNWSRLLRTTTQQAPVAGDVMHIVSDYTGAGARTDYVVTMNESVNTDYGTGVDGSSALTVSQAGTLIYSIAAATYLKLSGNLIVCNGGTLNIGTVANPVPRGTNAILEFDPVANGGMGLTARNGSTVTMQGLSRTVGKDVFWGLLIQDTVNGEKHFHIDTDTGWLSGDVVAIAATQRTYSQSETKILNGDAGAEIVNVTVAFGATVHHGTSPVQGEVILLTRNVKVMSATSTIMSFTNYKSSARVDIDWVEFYYLGENTYGKRPIDIETTSAGSINIQYSAVHDCEDYGVYIYNAAVADNFNVSNTVVYNISTYGHGVYLLYPGSTSNWTLSGNIVMHIPNPSGYCYSLQNVNGTITNNRAIGSYLHGIYVGESVVSGLGTFSGNVVHSCGSTASYGGLYIANLFDRTLSLTTIWRCLGRGIRIESSRSVNVLFDGLTMFGNGTSNIEMIASTSFMINTRFKDVVLNGDASFSTAYGLYLNNGTALVGVVFENGDFGTAGGIKTAHTAADIAFASGAYAEILLVNTKLGSGTEVSGISTTESGSHVRSQKHDQTPGLHRAWYQMGVAIIDTVYFHTASPSERLTPSSAALKLESGSKKREVDNGNTRTFSVWVRKSSVAAGGADYNGAQPRLILKKNIAAGIASDTVLDTMAVGLNTWEQLSGVTGAVTDDAVLECVVDCDGTPPGFINVDDWSAS